MQRIQSGSARGRALKSLPSHYPVRPILGRIKKSLFDILQFKIPNSQFLDLYAGTGSVGLEALSRGAKQCTFVELDPRCARLLSENLDTLGFSSRAKVVRCDVLSNLGHLPFPFDLIFMGPPYVDQEKNMLALTEPTLKNIVKYHLLDKAGMIISQRHAKEELKEIPDVLDKFREEKYGDTLVAFFKYK